MPTVMFKTKRGDLVTFQAQRSRAFEACDTCAGSGTVDEPRATWGYDDCPACGGSGRADDARGYPGRIAY